jgi:hypothetical protein
MALGLTMALLLMAATALARGGDDKAQELMAQARAALGGEAKLKGVQSLTASGKARMVVKTDDGEEQVESELELNYLLPDKYMKSETSSMGDGLVEITRISGINGDQVFRDARSTGGGMVMIRNAPDDPKQRAAMVKSAREDFARQLLVWLLATPDAFPVEFTYAGEAEIPAGKADAVDVKGPDGFAARLFLDKGSHRPALLSYRGPSPTGGMIMRRVEGNPEDMEKHKKEAEQMTRQAPEMADIQIFFADYRDEGGVTLPHRLTRSVNGQLFEEWELTKFKINPPLKADKFKK